VDWGHIRSIFRNWYHQKKMFFQILFDYWISFSLLIKKHTFINFLPKKQRSYDYFSEFASEALHIVIFENFVKSMTSCLSKLKVTPSFCFAFKIHDNVTATSIDKVRCPKSYVKLSKIRLDSIRLGIRKSHDALKLDDCYWTEYILL
jgi:hypothetical protein